MPRFLQPRRSGVHRLACLSLYHALLSQCSQLQRVNIRGDYVRKLVETRFRKYRTLESPSQIMNSLKAGYEALDLLSLCSKGSFEGVSRLQSLLGQTLTLAEEEQERCKVQAASFRSEFHPSNPKLHKAQARAEARARRRPEALRTHPNAEPILSRPRPHVSGRRRVPRFVVSQGVPFLRIKKPQPPSLARALRSKAANRWKKIVRHEKLTEELSAAEAEDKWDDIIGDLEESSYATAVKQNLQDTSRAIHVTDQKNLQLAQQMWEIILKERDLAAKEKEERKRIGRERWLKEQQKQSPSGESQETNNLPSETGESSSENDRFPK